MWVQGTSLDYLMVVLLLFMYLYARIYPNFNRRNGNGKPDVRRLLAPPRVCYLTMFTFFLTNICVMNETRYLVDNYYVANFKTNTHRRPLKRWLLANVKRLRKKKISSRLKKKKKNEMK